MLKVNNRNTWKRCEICSKLTRKTPKRYHLYFTPFSSTSIVDFISGKASYFRVITSTKQLLFRSSYFFRSATFLMSFFSRAVACRQQLLFQNIRRSKLWLSSHFLRIDSTLSEQLLFGWRNLFRTKISTEELLFSSRYFRTVKTFSEQVLFQQKYFLKRGSFTEQLLFGES